MLSTIHSANAIIETSTSLLLEKRPYLPGTLAYAGRLGLFGGSRKTNEPASRAIMRELAEELDFPQNIEPTRLWTGLTMGENGRGEDSLIAVSLFHLAIESAEDLKLQVEGELVELPKDLTVLEINRTAMAPFAYNALHNHLTDGAWDEYFDQLVAPQFSEQYI